MKLAFCLFNYFPYGGLQRDFLRIARACQENGHSIHIYTMKWEGEIPSGFKVQLIKARGWQNHTRSQSFVKQVKTQLDRERYDIVIGFNKMPHLDVYYAADVCYQARMEQRSWLYRLLPRYRHLVAFEKEVFDSASLTQILLISAKQQPDFERLYDTPKERFHLLPPGIAKDRLASSDDSIRIMKRKSFGLTDETILLLMVGSGFKTKGVDRTLQAIAALPAAVRARCQLKIIGQDNAESFIKLAKTLQIEEQVAFLGGRDDVPDIMQAADLLLHPAYHENTGTVLLEALASRLPVIASAVCGYAPYIMQAKAGIVLPEPFKQVVFNQALLQAITQDRHEWRHQAYEFALNADIYSMPTIAAKLIATMKKPIQASQSAYLHPELVQYFSKYKDLFSQLMTLRGEKFRVQKGRKTLRVRIGNEHYFIKQHEGVGLKEILKNLCFLRLPVVSAKNEWRAINKLQELGVPTARVFGYGERGVNPALRSSFVLMQDLTPSVSLEDLTKTWPKAPPEPQLKWALTKEVARISRVMHQNGINHRDFYLCHFLLDTKKGIQPDQLTLFLIDLHRAQMRSLTPTRWIIKDLAGLYFSSMQIGLTERDLYRFIKVYTGQSLKDVFNRDQHFWLKVKKRGEQLYRDHSI